MKKMLAGFIIGAVVCLLVMLTISSQTRASGEAATLPDGTDPAALMPDITAIYQQALALPYQQVETEITDPSIAAFFSKYMAATGLDKIGGQ
jgi:hypothetical protein